MRRLSHNFHFIFCQPFTQHFFLGLGVKKWCWLIAFYVIASKVTRQTRYRCMCRCVRYVITRITLRGNSCRLPERKCGQQEPRRSCRVLLPVNLCAKLQVPGAYKRQQASVVTSSFYTNSHTHTHRPPTYVCESVGVYVCCVYENSQVKGQAGVFNRHPKKHATIFCLFLWENESSPRGET